MEVEDNTIQKFWQWFVKNEFAIKECIENEDSRQREQIVDQLNEWILGLGYFTWDIGLNDENKWFLMISPNGNEDLLSVSQKIMAEAPEHMNWLFHAGKPAQNWNRQFNLYDEYMDVQFIDASSWHYLVFEDDEGMLELVIEAKNISHLDEDTADTAAEQFVVQELGERVRIVKISSIDVVFEFESEDEDSKISVLELRNHIGEVDSM